MKRLLGVIALMRDEDMTAYDAIAEACPRNADMGELVTQLLDYFGGSSTLDEGLAEFLVTHIDTAYDCLTD